MDSSKSPIVSWQSDTEFFWFFYKLIQANLLKYFKDKTAEATEFVRVIAKLHSESMCAELVPSGKKGKAPQPPTLPQLPKHVNDIPTPETLTNWTRDSEFYHFLYQLLLRNKSHFKSATKATETFISVLSKLHSKALNREYSAAPLTSLGNPEKFKVIQLAEENSALQAEIQQLKSQLTSEVNFAPKNGTLRGASVKK